MKPIKQIHPWGPPPGKYVPAVATNIRKTLQAAKKTAKEAT
jgi:hypothetical protein